MSVVRFATLCRLTRSSHRNSRKRIVGILAVLLICLWTTTACAAEAKAAGLRETASLDGEWQIVFDPQIQGRREGWFRPRVFAAQKSRPIQVPSCWEEIEQDYEGVAWYARRFQVPNTWKGKHVRLRFHAVNYLAEVWVNDEPVGTHEGGYSPFDLDISDLARYGEENFMVVRVVGPAVTRDIGDLLLRNESPHWRGAIVGGIWQSVELVATSPVFVKDVFVEPRIDRQEAVIHADIEKDSPGSEKAEVTFEVGDAATPVLGGRSKASYPSPPTPLPQGERGVWKQALELSEGKTNVSHVTVAVPIANPRLWSPDSPYLYEATVTVKTASGLEDRMSVRFGMREFTIRDGAFCLNGKRIFLKAGFWEGFYPSTLAHPKDPAIVRREILLAKEAGLNVLRPWRMPPVPMTLDLADELGILLIGSPAIECMGNWPAETPALESRWGNELRQLVQRDRNHPSIICWEVSNEIIRKSLLRLRHGMSLLVRDLDPTRLIIDESGGSRAVWGAHAYLPGSREPVAIVDRHIYDRSPLVEADYAHLATHGEPGKLGFTSEVGYGGMPDFAADVARYRSQGNPLTPDYRYHVKLLEALERCVKTNGLEPLFGDVSGLCRATQVLQAEGNKLQLEALRINPLMSGYCLHAFTDGDWVLGAGVLDLWREPKLMYQALKEVNRPRYLAVHVSPRNAYAADKLRVKITSVNELESVSGKLVLTALSREGKPLWRDSRDIEVPPGIKLLFEDQIDARGFSGECTMAARLESSGRTLAENRFGFLVMSDEDLQPLQKEVAVLDPRGRLKPFLNAHGMAFRDFIAGDASGRPVLVAASDAGNPQVHQQYVRLFDEVRRGTVAVLLDPPLAMSWPGNGIYEIPEEKNYLRITSGGKPRIARGKPTSPGASGLFPLKLEKRPARGMWIPVLHYMKPSPIFRGLPTGTFMGQPYQNVCALSTILGPFEGETLAGSVSWDFIQDYRGPTDLWWGADLAVVPHGKGKLILSTLQILDNLGKDPIADKLLYNLIDYAGTVVP